MPADSANRETVRQTLKTILESALVGSGKPVQAVYAAPEEPITESPVIVLTSGGSARQDSGIGDFRWRNTFKINCFIFIRGIDEANNWTAADIEDTLDLIDKKIADVIADNRKNSNWSYIGFSAEPGGKPEMSEITTDEERGYKLEVQTIYISYYESG